MSTFEKLQNLDKRVFYLLMALAIAIPTIRPIGLPVDVTPSVQKTFDFVSADTGLVPPVCSQENQGCGHRVIPCGTDVCRGMFQSP